MVGVGVLSLRGVAAVRFVQLLGSRAILIDEIMAFAGKAEQGNDQQQNWKEFHRAAS